MSRGEYIPNAATKLLLHLNGNSNDASGNGNNGTDTGIIYSQADGKFNQGANFNATSDKILIANESNFDFERTQPFTIGCWFKLADLSNLRFLVTKQVAGGNYNGWSLWINKIAYSSTFHLAINFSLVSTPTNMIECNYPYLSPTVLQVDKWYNLVVTYSGNSNASGVTIYLNGSKVTYTATSNNLTGSILNNTQVEIGNRNGAYNANGSIDEVIIENREWTAAQVKKYYTNATKPAIV